MVSGIRRLCSLAVRAAMLALVRATLRGFAGESRAIYIRGLVECTFVADGKAALDAFVGRVARGSWTQVEREQLFFSVCELFDAAFVADRTATLDAIVGRISQLDWTQAERERLFSSVCELFEAAGMSESVIECFERASGGGLHYSQEGEDVVLARLLKGRRHGFFVDIGAHHATRFSNTYALYRRGWRGLNVDATPGSMESFRRSRPEDVNLEAAISDRREPLLFSLFKEGALNTFDQQLARSYINDGWELKGTVELVPQTLAEILDRHLKEGQSIDLMSVDVEGEDLAVLRSNDWTKYCPKVIIIEALDTSLAHLDESSVVVFLKAKGFVPTSRLFNSIIFQRVASVCAAS